MKKATFKLSMLSLISMLILTTGCEDLFDLKISFYSEYSPIEFKILPVSDTGYHLFAMDTGRMSIDNILAENEMTIDDIESITINEAEVEILNLDTNLTFNIFKFIEASISSEFLPETQMAYQDTIPENVKKVKCKYGNNDLSDYVLSSEYYLSASGINRVPIEDTIYISGRIKFKIQTTLKEAYSAVR